MKTIYREFLYNKDDQNFPMSELSMFWPGLRDRAMKTSDNCLLPGVKKFKFVSDSDVLVRDVSGPGLKTDGPVGRLLFLFFYCIFGLYRP